VNLRVFLVVVSYSMLTTTLGLLWLSRMGEPEPELPWNDDARREIQTLVEQYYVEPLDDGDAVELFDGAMKGYVGGLDPFCRYFTPEERRALDEDTSGAFGGIGVHVRAVPGGVHVVAVRIDGPADTAGIETGDIIGAVDGEPLTGRDLGDMITLIKGEPGTDLVVSRTGADGGAPEPVTITRGSVGIDSVAFDHLFEGEPPVGYLRVQGFSEHTGTEVREVLTDLHDRGAGALVLDLRGNLGGVVTGAVEVVGAFMPAGTVVCWTRSRTRRKSYKTEAVEGFEPLDLPLVILVNAESASASEIVSGALQDHGRAVLVGERTFGKFLVQTIFRLDRREDAAVRVTTSKYLTPRGRSAQRASGALGGLQPDVRVLLDRDEHSELQLAFRTQVNERTWRVIEAERGRVPGMDEQLQAALALLRGGSAPPEPVQARVP